MIPVKQRCSRTHQVQPNHEPKLSPLDLPGDIGPSLLEAQTEEFSGFHVNHCTPYTYTIKNIAFPVTRCTPCTYINDSPILHVNHSAHYTYITDCPRCAINPRQSPNPQYLHPTPQNQPKLAKMPRRGPRPSKPTLNFSPSLLATTTRRTSTPVPNQNPQHPSKGSEPDLLKPRVLLEFR
jgi:hypothetical protein